MQQFSYMTDILDDTARRMPENDAVLMADAKENAPALTYRQLCHLSRCAGTALAENGVGNKQPVALLLEKSSYTIAALYGVLYSGGFYVFIDPAQPDSRLLKILNTLHAEHAVTEESGETRLREAGYQGKIYRLEELFSREENPDLLQGVREKADERDPLYAIFTSGSTGEPKGVVVSHRAAIDFIGHFVRETGIRATDRIGNQAPFDFDVSVKDIFSCCRTGAALVLIPRTHFALPRELLDDLCDRKITVLIWAVSAMCIVTTFRGFSYRVPENLRLVMFSGEVMPMRHLKQWQQALPDTEFINLYGPSEITCNCTYYRVPADIREEAALPIGVPFEGREVFIADENLQKISEPGVSGQICVSGESLADGYYGREDLTAKSFVNIDGKRTYLTGDLGWIGKDGLFYFSGRADSQIKCMGHRIELGEIETAMMRDQGVTRACCLFNQKNSRIYGFYTGSTPERDLRAWLKTCVPAYMVPNRLIQLESFQLNKNGKIDRNILMQRMEHPAGK